MSLHLYPDQWGKNQQWGADWITQHATIARDELKKPVLLGEYGSQNNQHETYKIWTDAVKSSGMNGDLFWMLAGHDENGQWYSNYDGYEVYCPASTEPTPGRDAQSCDVLTAHAKDMKMK